MWGEEFQLKLPKDTKAIDTDVEFDNTKVGTTLKYSFKRYSVGKLVYLPCLCPLSPGVSVLPDRDQEKMTPENEK